jgi:ribose transport system substrate-binding protein
MSARSLCFIVPALSASLLALTACHQHSRDETYFLISNNLKLPYWQTVNSGFERAASDYGVHARLVGPDTYNSAAELDAFRQAVASHPAGILISAADASSFRSDINDAIQAGIPVITLDSDAPVSQRLFFIGTDNLAAGRLGAERLAEKLNGKGNIVFFSIPGQPNLDERLRGYSAVIDDHPGMKIVDVLNVKGDPSIAFDQTRQYLARTGPAKIDAFVSLESSSGPAIAEVLKRSNVTDRTLIAMDVGPETLSLIKSGTIDATVSQKPWTMGYVGLKQLDEINHHKPQPFQNNYTVDSFSRYPQFINTGTALVTKDNVDIYIESANKAGAH